MAMDWHRRPTHRGSRRVVSAAILPVFVAAIGAAQQDAPTPTFRSGTKLVEVDVVARSNGAPATGLTKDDFTLLDNGKPQTIAFFSVMQSGSVAPPPAIGVVALPAGVVSNRLESRGQPSGNTKIVFLDQRNTPAPDQAHAIQSIARFIGTRRPQDRTAIYTLGRNGIKIVQEITSDTDLLSRAAGSLKWADPDVRSPDVSGLSDRPTALGPTGPGRGVSGVPEGPQGHAADEFTELLIRLREIDTKQTLEMVARHLANVPGRKSLIWISAAFPLHWRDLDFTPDMLEAARKLNDAGVALYAVDPRGVAGALSAQTNIAPAEFGGVFTDREQIVSRMIGEGNFPPPFGSDTMGLLANLTGGLAFGNDNGIDALIESAANDGEFTYTLGFYPAQEDRDGARHALKVFVSKPGVNLRYRRNYLASPATGAANDRPTLQQLLNDASDQVELEVAASASPADAEPGSWQVKVNVNIRDLQLANEDSRHGGEIDVSFHVEGAPKVVTKTLRVAIPDDQFAAFLEKGIETTQTIDAADSAAAVRVVVQDRTSGAAGSVTVPLNRR